MREVVSFMKKTDTRLDFFSVSIFFSVLLVLINIYIVSLLFPLSRGVISGDFSHVQNERFIGILAHAYPDIFSGPIRLFLLFVVWVYLMVVIKNIIKYFSVISTDYQSKRAIFTLRNLLLGRCLVFEKSFFDKNQVHRIHHTISESSSVIEKQMTLFKNFIIQCSLLVVFGLSMLYVSWTLTLVSVVLFPVINFFIRRSVRNIRRDIKAANSVKDSLNLILSNILNGMFVIKSFAREDEEAGAFLRKNREDLEKSFRVKKLSNVVSVIEDIGDTTMVLSVAFGMAFVMHRVGGIDATHAFVFLYLTQKVAPILNSFHNFRLRVEELKKSVTDVNEILDEGADGLVADGDRPFVGLNKGISIKNLNFSYAPDSAPVLKNVNAFFEQGKLTAIVGPSGSGKSTLLSLLLRFYGVEPGTIFMDDIDLTDVRKNDLRRSMAFVGQDVVLFNDSVIHNIMYGSTPETSDQVKKDVLSRLGINAFVNKLPEKYETLIAEKGANFSGGQKQRIAIARALLSRYEVLLLDEVTSSLDPVTEAKVFDAICEHSKGKTCIIASHRLSLIKRADTIIYIEDGSATEQGSWDELIALRGKFFKRWQLQGSL
jgi:ABC-type multidrug transport system fused ATPase/permease subunit